MNFVTTSTVTACFLTIVLALNCAGQSTEPTVALSGYPTITLGPDTGLFVPRADARKMLNDYTYLSFLQLERVNTKTRLFLLEQDRARADSIAVSYARDYEREKAIADMRAQAIQALISQNAEMKKAAKRARIRSVLWYSIAIPSAAGIGFGLGYLAR